MRTAAKWARLLRVDKQMQREFLEKASKLSDYPLTVDPTFGNRTVWSEAKVQRWDGDPTPTTIDQFCTEDLLPNGERCRDSTPFHANYMYPIVQFAPMHPTNLVNTDSPEATLRIARQTVSAMSCMYVSCQTTLSRSTSSTGCHSLGVGAEQHEPMGTGQRSMSGVAICCEARGWKCRTHNRVWDYNTS
eukprot:SAG31_NODE_1227_length_9239_cov_29.041904_6_plen_189_part_00